MDAPRPVYLDYAATTPVDPRVAAAMARCLTLDGDFGNPSSRTHAYGAAAHARVEQARAAVAALVGADPSEIIFTSGATESNNLALLGTARASADRRRHIVTARTEHRAVLDPCRRLEKEGFEISWIVPGRDGRIDPLAIAAAVRPDTLLVSVMHANNEIGVVQDVAAIGALCRERGALFHCDAAQSAGKLPIDLRRLAVDYLSLTAHKFCGPKGVGALYVRTQARPWIAPLVHGGGQERGLRSGTLPTHQIVGFGVAAELAMSLADTESRQVAGLRERLEAGLEALPGVTRNGSREACLPGIVNLSFEGVEGESLLAAVQRELAVATGSACSSATQEPSYVLRALGASTELAQSSLRFSLGRFSTAADVDRAIEVVSAAVQRLRRIAPRPVTRRAPL